MSFWTLARRDFVWLQSKYLFFATGWMLLGGTAPLTPIRLERF